MTRLLCLLTLSWVICPIAFAQTSNEATQSIACPVESGPPPVTSDKWILVSGIEMQRYRVSGKNPKYPKDARRQHIQGSVRLIVTISTNGDIADLCVGQGPEMLQRAAFDAIKTWKYKPFVVNDQPVEVKTVVNVQFLIK